jgi:hypothetical protein
MRHHGRVDPAEAKRIARKRYAERKVDKWIKWSWKMRGKVLMRELIEQQEKYGIKC